MIYYNVDYFDYDLLEIFPDMKNSLKNEYPYSFEFEEKVFLIMKIK